MRKTTAKFNKDECIKNASELLRDKEITELPHYDTINDFLETVPPEEIGRLRHKLIARIIQMKCFEAYKFKNRWPISVDGTGIYVFKNRHCEHCLTKTYNKGKANEYTLYFHYVLEAKLIVGEIALSIYSEFIENPENLKDKMFNEDFDEKAKQDCELKAFYRLAENMKKEYPRLPVCLLLDSLYANQNVYKSCSNNGWEYIIRFKEGSLPNVAAEFEVLSNYDGNVTAIEDESISSKYSFVNEIEYEGHEINIIEFTETKINAPENTIESKAFRFITSSGLIITERNQKDIVNNGRKRWKIENHGFNEQKNHGYELEHPFCLNLTAMKNHYMLIQIAI